VALNPESFEQTPGNDLFTIMTSSDLRENMRTLPLSRTSAVFFSWLPVAAALLLAWAAVSLELRHSHVFVVYYVSSSLLLLVTVVGMAIQNAIRSKDAEFAMRESEERFCLVSNSARLMIWMSGPDKLRTYFNKPWLDFTGRPLSAELGNGWAVGIHAEDSDRCMEIYNQAFDRREEFKMEYRLFRYDGKYRWISDTGAPRLNADGSFAGYIATCIDVTEQRRAAELLSDVSSRLIQAQENERTRIARELHDDISQRLAMTVIEIEGLKAEISGFNPGVIDRIDHLQQYIAEIANDVQSISHELHSARLEHLGVETAMRGFCQEFGEKHKLQIDFRCHDVPGYLPVDTSLCLFRVLQEAAHNGAKHSRAPRLQVQCWGAPGEVQLTVTDAGVGFAVETACEGRGLGLISMRERVKLVNGTISIVSEFNRGTKIHVRIPVKVPFPNSHGPAYTASLLRTLPPCREPMPLVDARSM